MCSAASGLLSNLEAGMKSGERGDLAGGATLGGSPPCSYTSRLSDSVMVMMTMGRFMIAYVSIVEGCLQKT